MQIIKLIQFLCFKNWYKLIEPTIAYKGRNIEAAIIILLSLLSSLDELRMSFYSY
jgi:hypothetical protein